MDERGSGDGLRENDGAETERALIGRRRFLQYGAATVGGTLAGTGLWRIDRAIAVPSTDPVPILPGRGPKPTFTTVLRRREDQLRLRFELYNLVLDTSGPQPALVRKNVNSDAHVVVQFLPQHVMEEAFYEYDPALQVVAPPDNQDDPDPTTDDAPAPPPVGSRLAGASRLAFRVPEDVASIEYSPAGLLGWDAWIPSVVPVALQGPLRAGALVPKLQAPGPTHTALELPWWLVLSPHVQTGWVHELGPVEHGTRTELWHTRFGGRPPGADVDEHDESRKTMRAVWARDPDFAKYLNHHPNVTPADGEDFEPFHPIGMPFRTSLSPRDRFDLVVSTADFEHAWSETGYVPQPAKVARLMLTSLGAWLDLQGEWRAEPGVGTSGTSLQAWRHIATTGRDHYVRIVRSGFLFPFGHAASLIKVTERKFRTIGSGSRGDPKRRVAYLFQRYFIVIRQREVAYGGQFQPADGRAFPFTRLRATTLITPNLDPSGSGSPEPDVGGNTTVFVPRVGGAPFRFHLVGTDRAGRTADVHASTVFVDATLATDPGVMDDLIDWYEDLSPTAVERSVHLQGQKVAVAPPADPGSTDLEVQRLTLGAELPTTNDPNVLDAAMQPAYFPTMAEAEIRLAAAETAVGTELAGSLPVVILDPGYVANDFAGAGPGEVFVRLKDTNNPKHLNFAGESAGDRAGGVITPNLGITALSRKTGTVGGDPDTYQSGDFDPAAFFGGLNATLLGDLTLAQVIEAVTGVDFDLDDPAKRDRIMQLITREEPQAVVTELRWRPKLKSFGDLFVPGPNASLALDATIATPKANPTGATFVVVGDLQDFTVGLLEGAPFIKILFDRLRFQQETGKSADVDVEIREVVFDGPLKFVNQLKDYLTFSSGGFSIELQPTQLKAGFQIPLPGITVGVFSLRNITFAAGTTIPFTGKPIRFRFGLSTLENPFLLSVMIFGGGGSSSWRSAPTASRRSKRRSSSGPWRPSTSASPRARSA